MVYIIFIIFMFNHLFLKNFLSLQGPVYAVQWSPFNSNVFLSSSTDWDVKVWHQDNVNAAFSLTSPLVSADAHYLLQLRLLLQVLARGTVSQTMFRRWTVFSCIFKSGLKKTYVFPIFCTYFDN